MGSNIDPQICSSLLHLQYSNVNVFLFLIQTQVCDLPPPASSVMLFLLHLLALLPLLSSPSSSSTATTSSSSSSSSSPVYVLDDRYSQAVTSSALRWATAEGAEGAGIGGAVKGGQVMQFTCKKDGWFRSRSRVTIFTYIVGMQMS